MDETYATILLAAHKSKDFGELLSIIGLQPSWQHKFKSDMEEIKGDFEGFIKFEDLLSEYNLYLGEFITARLYDKRHYTDYECEAYDVLIKHRSKVSTLRYEYNKSRVNLVGNNCLILLYISSGL